MSKVLQSNSEAPHHPHRVPIQISKSLDTSVDSSWCLPIPDTANPNFPSDYVLTLNTEESMEAFAEYPTPSYLRGFDDPNEVLSPIKFNSRANVNIPSGLSGVRAETPKLKIGCSSFYLNNSENLQGKKFNSPCPSAAKRIVKKKSGQVGVWSYQNLDDVGGEKQQDGNMKNKKDLREDFKNFIKFRNNLKQEQGPTNLCQEMFKGFKISEVRSFLKSQIANA